MPSDERDETSGTEFYRRNLMRELARRRTAERILYGFSAFLIITWLLLSRRYGLERERWDLLAILFTGMFMGALPLFTKFGFGKDGFSFEAASTADLIGRIQELNDKQTAETRQATAEQSAAAFQNLTTQLGAVADQVAEIKRLVSARQDAESPVGRESAGPGPQPTAATVDFAALAESRLMDSMDSADVQKGRFRRDSVIEDREVGNGWRLAATVTQSSLNPQWQDIKLSIVSDNSANRLLDAEAVFFVHDTFKPNVFQRRTKDGHAELDLISWGAFTAGVAINDGKDTRLEIDLARSRNVVAPDAWRNR